MKYYFYKTTNLINGKYYYGSSTLERYKNYLGSGKIITRALNKYGKENFKHEKLKFFETREEAFLFEARFLKIFKVSEDKNSYNIKNEGLGGDTFTNNPNKEQIRKKISDHHKKYGVTYSKQCHEAATVAKKLYHPSYGSLVNDKIKREFNKRNGDKIRRHFAENPHPMRNKSFDEYFGEERSQYIREKISKGVSGENHPNYGKHLSEETKRKIGEKSKLHRHSDETKQKISNSKRGTILSEEHKQKISKALTKDINISDCDKQNIIELYNEYKMSVKKISKKLNIKAHYIYSLLKDNNIEIKKYRRDEK